MNYSEEFIESQKASLLLEKKKVEDEIEKLKIYPDYGSDEEDNMQELTDYESNLIIDTEIEEVLARINKALDSIEQGTYGVCANCKEAILEERLKIMPWADVCLNCGKETK